MYMYKLYSQTSKQTWKQIKLVVGTFVNFLSALWRFMIDSESRGLCAREL